MDSLARDLVVLQLSKDNAANNKITNEKEF